MNIFGQETVKDEAKGDSCVFSRVVQWPTQSRHLNFTIWPHSLASMFLGLDSSLCGYVKV